MSSQKAGTQKTLTDEISAARRRRRRRYRVRRFTTLVLMAMLAFLIILVISNVNMFTVRNVGDMFTTTFAGGSYPVLLGSTKPLKTISLSGAYATLTNTEVVVNADRGREIQRIQHNFGNPAIAGNGSKFMLYDRGNRSFSVYSRTELFFSAESSYAIIAADVASDGTAILLTQGDRSVSELKVLSNTNYTTLFTWQGSKGFPLFCGISENGDEAYVAGLRYLPSGMTTVLTFLDVGTRAEKAEIELGGIFMRLWHNGSHYTVLTDKGVYALGTDYAIEASYTFSNLPVITASKENGPLAIAFGDNNQSDVNYILLLSDKLEEIITIESIGVVGGIHMGADRVYVLSNGVVYALQTDGKLVESYETDLNAYGIFLVKGRLTVLMPDRLEQPERVRESGEQFGEASDSTESAESKDGKGSSEDSAESSPDTPESGEDTEEPPGSSDG